MMDIEKLIERLNRYFEGEALPRGTALDAATALSTLQDENEKLMVRNTKLEDTIRSQRNGLQELRAELEQVKREHGMFQPVLNGKNAQEKQAILVRLRVYRKARGLGCLEEVAREAGTGFTEDLLRGLLTGDSSISIPQWRKLNKALDKLENSEEVPGE